MERDAALVVKGIHNVRITGATGPAADDVNGVYKPTEEMCDNATVYVKVGDDDKWLEYNASDKQWRVKLTRYKGTYNFWASCDVIGKCLPQDCPVGKWQVHDGTWESQPAVTVLLWL